MLDYDVVVVGAGAGGVAAAIQAARMGATVALIEETGWIGGQMTAAAVTSMDEGSPDIRTGLYGEFVERIRQYYQSSRKSIGTCYWTDQSVSFEPHVGRHVLAEMIHDTRSTLLPNRREVILDLFFHKEVLAVLKSGAAVTGVRTKDGLEFRSKITVDATECGDLLPLAGAQYRLGNSQSPHIDLNACIQDITYLAVVKKYPPGSMPSELIFSSAPPGYDQMKPYFEKLVTTDGADWDPTGQRFPISFGFHNAYRGMPDSSNPRSYTASQTEARYITKTAVNFANNYPAKEPYISRHNSETLKTSYIEDRNFRELVNADAKLKTLQFIYYIQHELGETSWSIANDEGFDLDKSNRRIDLLPHDIAKHLPVIPYIREGRRLVGLHTLTAGEIKREGAPPRARKEFPTGLVVGYYPVDLHNCDCDSTLEAGLGETRDDIPSGAVCGPFQVPFECFIPKEVDGFLPGGKNISVSRLAGGAIRLGPSEMLIGQASGAIAAISVEQRVPPRQLNPVLVQQALTEQ